jgi:hypothetical protein
LGDDPFFGVAVGNGVLGAELVEEIAAANAEFCFQGGRGVVEACVNDLVAIDRLLGQTVPEFGGINGLTSELRLLVSVPGVSCRSRRMVEVPSRAASCLATDRPTTPAPITYTRSALSS